jgi:tetratricopeptide (TPR) repeat protein
MTLIVRDGNSSTFARPLPQQIPTLNSIQQVKKSTFDAMISLETEKHSIKNYVQQFKVISSQIATLHHDCQELQKESEKEIENLPCYYFLQKWRFWLVRQDLWFCSVDKASHDFGACRSLLRELDERIHHLVTCKLGELKTFTAKNCEESFEIASLYDELAKLEPKNPLPQEALAHWLLEQKVYQEAHKVFGILAKKAPLNYGYQVNLIKALMGKGAFQEAREKISDLKLKITLDEYNKPKTITSALHLSLFELDTLKADCLAHEKNYDEALQLLNELLKKSPNNNEIKHKIIAVMTQQEIEACDFDTAFDEKTKHYFLACPKIMFASLDEFKENTFSKNSLISEVEFWAHTLFTQPKLYNSLKARTFILEKIKDIIDTKRIAKDLIIQKLQNRLQQLTEAHDIFEKKFYSLAQKSIEPQGERQQAILKAQAKQLEQALNGEEALYGSIGLIKKKDIVELILKNLDLHPHFQDQTTKVQIITLANRVESQGHRIQSCIKSYVHLESTLLSHVQLLTEK